MRDPRKRRIASAVARRPSLIAFVAILPLFFPLTATLRQDVDDRPGLHRHGARAEHRGRASRGCSTWATSPSTRSARTRWAGSRPATSSRTTPTASLSILAGPQAEGLVGIHLNFLLIILAAVVICAIAGILIGLPTLRLRGDYIAIVTLAFGEIIRVVAINGEQIKLVRLRADQRQEGHHADRPAGAARVRRAAAPARSTSGRGTGSRS